MSLARPTEIKALVAIMESELFHPKTGEPLGAEGYAKACIDKLDELRTERPFFHIITEWKGNGSAYFGYGPYATDNRAREAAEAGKLPLVSLGHAAVVAKIFHPRHADQTLEGLDQ